MKSPAAFRACYSDWKLIKTRAVVQVVMEVPLTDADVAYNVLGGMPDSARESWFAVAPLKSGREVPRPEAVTAWTKREWKELQPQQQAGIRCAQPTFVAFLKERRPDDWRESADAADCVRLICGVLSRVELSTNHKARVLWHQLDEQFLAWKLADA